MIEVLVSEYQSRVALNALPHEFGHSRLWFCIDSLCFITIIICVLTAAVYVVGVNSLTVAEDIPLSNTVCD